MSDPNFDVIIIGNGITGLTAGKRAAEAGLATATIEALLFGGLIVNINELEGASGGEEVSGSFLASTLMMELSELGVSNMSETVTALERDGQFVKVKTDGGEHVARAVIVASGAQLKRLGIPGEMEFDHRGVSQCADCDGPMYQGQDVVVVGGGDSALQEALVLANFCKHVYLVHRGTKFSARQHFVDEIAARKNVEPVWNSVAEEVLGSEMVEKVRVRNVASGETKEIPCTGFFAYVGLKPNSDFVSPEVKRDSNGCIVTDASLHTTMDGVFAAGAVRAGYSGLMTDAIAEAGKAVQSVRARLRK